MKRCLVTGGAGFIGSHIAEGLLERGHRVIVLDDESTGRRENVPRGAEYRRGDVRDTDDLEAVFRHGIDVVFHIAGRASTIKSFRTPKDDLQVNVHGTLNVLEMCLKHHVPRLLYASSMTVYGHPEQIPIAETAVCRPVSYYGVTKYAAERYVHSTGERNDLGFEFHVTSFRMFNVYGPRQSLTNPYQGVMAIFIGNVMRNEPITIFGDGEQSRDFVYIADVVRAWLAAMDEPATYGQVFNIGSGERISINRLADAVLGALGFNGQNYQINYEKARPGDQRHMEADVTHLGATLGWRPAMDFWQGMEATVEWARGRSKEE